MEGVVAYVAFAAEVDEVFAFGGEGAAAEVEEAGDGGVAGVAFAEADFVLFDEHAACGAVAVRTQGVQRGFGGFLSGEGGFVGDAVVLREGEQGDEGAQGQALEHQGARTTPKAEKMMRSRWAKPSGRARAAARVTMPRMPHQEMSTPPAALGSTMGRAVTAPKRRFFQRTAALKLMTQAMRTRMTVARMAPAKER